MFEEIELFNQKVKIRNYFCSSNPNKFEKSNLKLNLYIKINDACSANCQFCSNRQMKDNGQIDFDKLKYVLNELKNKDLINRISITGGEPLLTFDSLNKTINLVFEIIPDAELTINTNGYNLSSILKLDNLNKIEGIHISRHHYDDSINNDIFGINTATYDDIKNVIDKLDNKKLLRLNCLLMKDYISSLKEAEKYLEKASNLGIFRVGFVSLMPINDFSKEQFINFNDVFKEKDEKMLDTGHYYDHKLCECHNGLYIANNGKLIEYYARMTKELNCDYARQLVYTSDNKLTIGFGKKPLI